MTKEIIGKTKDYRKSELFEVYNMAINFDRESVVLNIRYYSDTVARDAGQRAEYTTVTINDWAEGSKIKTQNDAEKYIENNPDILFDGVIINPAPKN